MNYHRSLLEKMAANATVTVATTVALAVYLIVVTGCGPSQQIDANLLANAQSSYDAAVEQEAAGNSEEVLRLLDEALNPEAGLSPDVSVEARILRAIVLTRLGRSAEAHDDLDMAAEGAGDMAAIHVARAFVLKSEGNSSESKAEMRKAKRLNRSARPISE